MVKIMLIVLRMFPVVLAFTYFAVNARPQASPLPEPGAPQANCAAPGQSPYLLGPDDQVDISAVELTEAANKPVRIDSDGNIEAPLVGRVHVAGLTVQQSEEVLDKSLSAYIRHPQVTVNLVEVRSQPVSVLGAVNTPGVHQVQGSKTLLEMLALAGGLRQDAGYSIRITRRMDWGCLPLPGARVDPTGQFSVAELEIMEITEAKNPQENIQILPHDVISVPKAEMVYVIGEVHRAGGFTLDEHRSISLLQALSLAEGTAGTADTKHARILRRQQGADQRQELSVDIKAVLAGKKPDVMLEGDDILFVPDSTGKKAGLRTLEAVIQTGTGLAIWHLP